MNWRNLLTPRKRNELVPEPDLVDVVVHIVMRLGDSHGADLVVGSIAEMFGVNPAAYAIPGLEDGDIVTERAELMRGNQPCRAGT